MSKPTCPKCGSQMVARHNKRTGEQFWGCSQYPGCTGTRPGAAQVERQYRNAEARAWHLHGYDDEWQGVEWF